MLRPPIIKCSILKTNEISGTEDRYEFVLQPLTDIHLKSNLEVEFEPGGN